MGHAGAAGNLGVCYMTGAGVPRDPVAGAAWFRHSAEAGNALSQFNLGICFAWGDGVAVDRDEALVWWRLAAAGGNADAMFNVGNAYWNGACVADAARTWWQRAAEAVHARARDVHGHQRSERVGAECAPMLSCQLLW